MNATIMMPQSYKKDTFIACAEVSYHRDIVLSAESFMELHWNKTLSPGAAVQLQDSTLSHYVLGIILKSHAVAVKQIYSPLLATN